MNGTATSPTSQGADDLDSVPETALLDVSASKSKAHLASAGALATRRPPTKTTHSSVSQPSYYMLES